MGKKGVNCWNRDVVHVNYRLHSPYYDSDGKPGRPWWIEPHDRHAMCYLGVCDFISYNAWIDATDAYFQNELIPQFDKMVDESNSHYGGAALPQQLADKLNKVASVINGWDEFDKTHKTVKDDFFHLNPMYWEGEIKKVIAFFDEGACNMDILDEIAVVDLKRPYTAKGVPKRTIEPVEGGFLGNPAGTESASGGMSKAGMAVGLVALGAAGYFGFKVLTE